MTKFNVLDLFDNKDFPAIGKNPFFDVFSESVYGEKYPPYNIVSREKGYLIEIAVPGWDTEDLEVTFEDRILKVAGKKREATEESEKNYVFKSLSTKGFSRFWTVGKDLEVGAVYLEKGLLCIDINHVYKPEAPNLLTIDKY